MRRSRLLFIVPSVDPRCQELRKDDESVDFVDGNDGENDRDGTAVDIGVSENDFDDNKNGDGDDNRR